jgi:hypothetical protein
MEVVITVLLAANTATVGIAAAMLFKRLDMMDASISRAHGRLDDHVERHHTFHQQEQRV